MFGNYRNDVLNSLSVRRKSSRFETSVLAGIESRFALDSSQGLWPQSPLIAYNKSGHKFNQSPNTKKMSTGDSKQFFAKYDKEKLNKLDSKERNDN